MKFSYTDMPRSESPQVMLTFYFTDGTWEEYAPIRWEYTNAHEGFHPAEYLIITAQNETEHKRWHIPADKVKAIYVDVDRTQIIKSDDEI